MKEIDLIIVDGESGQGNPILIATVPDAPTNRELFDRIVRELNETELLRDGCTAKVRAA